MRPGLKGRVLDDLLYLTEDELREVSTKAHNMAWNMRGLTLTADHEAHERNRVLVEGCFKCFTNGERVGG